jgi:hypothetical protein
MAAENLIVWPSGPETLFVQLDDLRSPRTSSAFQSTRSRVPMVRSEGSIHSGLAPVRGRNAPSICDLSAMVN